MGSSLDIFGSHSFDGLATLVILEFAWPFLVVFLTVFIVLFSIFSNLNKKNRYYIRSFGGRLLVSFLIALIPIFICLYILYLHLFG